MSLFDWVEVGAEAAPDSGFGKWFEKNFPGSFSITLGDALSSVMPSGQQAHIYGDSIQYTVDWEGIIIDGFLGKIPGVGHALESGAGGVVMGVLAGAGGYCNFVYGRNIGAVYGPTTTVQRGPTTTITGKNWLFGGSAPSQANPFTAAAITPAQTGQQSSIDNVVQVITSILSGLMILTGLVTEVLATTVFKQGDALTNLLAKMADIGKGNDSNVQNASPDQKTQTAFGDAADAADADDPNAKLNKLMKMLSWGLTSRFMGVIIAVEKIGQEMRDAVYRLPSVEAQLSAAKTDLDALDVRYGVATRDLATRLLRAEQDAATATRLVQNAVDALANVVAGVKNTAEQAAQDATERHLLVNNWEVGADGYIRLVGYDSVSLEATGDEGVIMADAPRSASVRSKDTKLILGGAAGQALLSAGDTGEVVAKAGVEDLGSKATLTPEKMTLQVGVPDIGASITLEPLKLTLAVGGPDGSSITMGPAGIQFRVGTVTKEIYTGGITEAVAEVTREVTPEGHNLTAAETVMNVGVEGVTIEMPTNEEETEAAAEINITLQNLSVDSVSTMEITLTILE